MEVAREKEKIQADTRPGKRVVEDYRPRVVVEVRGCMDDGKKVLSAARFLRPPEEYESIWKHVPQAYREDEPCHWDGYFGTAETLPMTTHLARQDRLKALECRFWARKNSKADMGESKVNTKSRPGGACIPS